MAQADVKAFGLLLAPALFALLRPRQNGPVQGAAGAGRPQFGQLAHGQTHQRA